jgi:hypothetical protein
LEELKTRWSLLPPDIMKDIADVFTSGAVDHGDYTWQTKPADYHYDAAQRHQNERAMGVKIDDGSGKPPLINAIARLIMTAWKDKHGEER